MTNRAWCGSCLEYCYPASFCREGFYRTENQQLHSYNEQLGASVVQLAAERDAALELATRLRRELTLLEDQR
jgi:hypothetical protein